jgi:hypothetical protein
MATRLVEQAWVANRGAPSAQNSNGVQNG